MNRPSFCTLLLVASASAQVTWTPATYLESRQHHALATDTVRGRTVLFGGARGTVPFADTWEWDGAVWSRRSPATSPPARQEHAMAFDAARGRVVLFGGGGGSGLLGDTWEWDGANWTQRSPATSPAARFSHGMAYDSVRGRVVLFGGSVGGAKGDRRADTWEWDGSNWTPVSPATSPAPRDGHALAYDALRNRTVLFGGMVDGVIVPQLVNDTWEWDGSSWTKRTPAQSPAALLQHALAFDSVRGRTVLFAAQSRTLPGSAQTWEWDGTNWLRHTPAVQPPARLGHALAFDAARGRVIVHGGWDEVGFQSDTWEWDGTTWALRQSSSSPAVAYNTALAHDEVRGRVVLHGGFAGTYFGETWEWDGSGWLQRFPAATPGPVTYHALAYDFPRARTVLFGGYKNGAMANETWEWDGTTWAQRTPANQPPPMQYHAMAHDAARGRAVLFGGYTAQGVLSGTWEWDGANWTELQPANRPPARVRHALAYDFRRGRVLMFGGDDAVGARTWFADLWQWDGTDWAQIPTGQGPSARSLHAMSYDRVRDRMVVMGGNGAAGDLGDTWEWDSTSWTQRAPVRGPGARSSVAMAYDAGRERTVLFGGPGDVSTWEYGAVHAATYVGFGAGCAGSAGVPRLAARRYDRPWIGSSFTLELEALPATGAVFVFLGFSRASWAGVPLPLALGALGMPGCSLLVSGELLLPAVNTGGAASLPVSVVNDAAIVGLPIYNQALVVDPGANALGAVMSNGGEGRIGAK